MSATETRFGTVTTVTLDGVTTDALLVSRGSYPCLHIGSVIARPPKTRDRDGIDADLAAIAEWGRVITAQAEAHLAARASTKAAS